MGNFLIGERCKRVGPFGNIHWNFEVCPYNHIFKTETSKLDHVARQKVGFGYTSAEKAGNRNYTGF